MTNTGSNVAHRVYVARSEIDLGLEVTGTLVEMIDGMCAYLEPDSVEIASQYPRMFMSGRDVSLVQGGPSGPSLELGARYCCMRVVNVGKANPEGRDIRKIEPSEWLPKASCETYGRFMTLEEHLAENHIQGIVCWFQEDRGVGFITPVNGGVNIYAHAATVQMKGYKRLFAGRQVFYTEGQNHIGPCTKAVWPYN